MSHSRWAHALLALLVSIPVPMAAASNTHVPPASREGVEYPEIRSFFTNIDHMNQQCSARSLQAFRGTQWSDSMAEEVLMESGAASLRVIPPGAPLTFDMRRDRLNIHLNTSGTMTRITCG